MQHPSPIATTRLRAAQRLLLLLVAIVAAILVGTTTVASASPAFKPASSSRITVRPAAETRVGVAATPIGTRLGPSRSVVAGQVGQRCPRLLQTVVGSCVATNRLATGTDDAVFWSGIGRGGDATAASWAAKNGGATLESTMAQRGIQLPAWDASNPSVVSAWRQASADFASGASGNVRVLQGADVRIGSVWAEVEYPALVSNPNVTSITSINPATGEQVVLWTRP